MSDEFILDITPAVKAPDKSNRLLKFVNGIQYEYELYPLLDEYDPLLKKPCEPFVFEGENKTPIQARLLAVSLIETMKKYSGIGLAAVQCGIPYDVFVMGGDGFGAACFNPVIVAGYGMEKGQEGCLSYPGLFLPIPRCTELQVKYQDMNGEWKEQKFTGLTARVFQHEYDHLDGTCFTTLVSPMVLDRAKRKVKKNLKLLKAQKVQAAKDALIREAVQKLHKEALAKKFPDANSGYYFESKTNT